VGLTELVADPGAGCYTADAGRGQHGGRVALFFLLVPVLALFAVGISVACAVGVWVAVASWVAPVALVVGGAEQTALVVVSCVAVWRTGGTAEGWRVRALSGGCVCGRLPLAASRGLVDVVPSGAALVELRDPTGGHGWWRAVLAHD
jgi:hypothetical protein